MAAAYCVRSARSASRSADINWLFDQHLSNFSAASNSKHGKHESAVDVRGCQAKSGAQENTQKTLPKPSYLPRTSCKVHVECAFSRAIFLRHSAACEKPTAWLRHATTCCADEPAPRANVMTCWAPLIRPRSLLRSPPRNMLMRRDEKVLQGVLPVCCQRVLTLPSLCADARPCVLTLSYQASK